MGDGVWMVPATAVPNVAAQLGELEAQAQHDVDSLVAQWRAASVSRDDARTAALSEQLQARGVEVQVNAPKGGGPGWVSMRRHPPQLTAVPLAPPAPPRPPARMKPSDRSAAEVLAEVRASMGLPRGDSHLDEFVIPPGASRPLGKPRRPPKSAGATLAAPPAAGFDLMPVAGASAAVGAAGTGAAAFAPLEAPAGAMVSCVEPWAPPAGAAGAEPPAPGAAAAAARAELQRRGELPVSAAAAAAAAGLLPTGVASQPRGMASAVAQAVPAVGPPPPPAAAPSAQGQAAAGAPACPPGALLEAAKRAAAGGDRQEAARLAREVLAAAAAPREAAPAPPAATEAMQCMP